MESPSLPCVSIQVVVWNVCNLDSTNHASTSLLRTVEPQFPVSSANLKERYQARLPLRASASVVASRLDGYGKVVIRPARSDQPTALLRKQLIKHQRDVATFSLRSVRKISGSECTGLDGRHMACYEPIVPAYKEVIKQYPGALAFSELPAHYPKSGIRSSPNSGKIKEKLVPRSTYTDEERYES